MGNILSCCCPLVQSKNKKNITVMPTVEENMKAQSVKVKSNKQNIQNNQNNQNNYELSVSEGNRPRERSIVHSEVMSVNEYQNGKEARIEKSQRLSDLIRDQVIRIQDIKISIVKDKDSKQFFQPSIPIKGISDAHQKHNPQNKSNIQKGQVREQNEKPNIGNLKESLLDKKSATQPSYVQKSSAINPSQVKSSELKSTIEHQNGSVPSNTKQKHNQRIQVAKKHALLKQETSNSKFTQKKCSQEQINEKQKETSSRKQQEKQTQKPKQPETSIIKVSTSVVQSKPLKLARLIYNVLDQGLPNSSLLCFLNSSIQLLYAASNFKKALQKTDLPEDENSYSRLLGRLYRVMDNKLNHSNSKKDIISLIVEKLQKNKQDYDGQSQQDALEFLFLLLNCILEEIPDLSSLFEVYFQNECKCPTNNKTVFKEFYLTLGMSCANCGSPLKLMFMEHPTYVILVSNGSKPVYQDLYFKVKPDSDMKPESDAQSQKNKCHLQLKASIIYDGNGRCGHYYSRRKSDKDDRWYEFNDQKVTPLDTFQQRLNRKHKILISLYEV